MKEIISKNISPKWLKRRKKDEAKLTQYWSNMYPTDYAKDMTRDYLAFSNGLIKMANDAVDVVFSGELRQTEDGFVFVDVPDSVFEGLLPLLGENAERPPKNEKHYNDIGAHITVMKRSEVEDNNIKFKHVGKKVSYQMKGVKKVENPDGWDSMESVWFISIESPDLQNIRRMYGLSPTIKDHDFHITLGVKRRILEDLDNA